ncbi:MAG: type II secretion system F family protein [Rhodospirillales bacterium]|nr:type II secretion system F family protein [Rhodospirillales bacterium]
MDNRILMFTVLAAVILALVTAAAMMLLREARIGDLENRIRRLSVAVQVGGTEQQRGTGLATRMLQGLGQFVRSRTKLYSERDLKVLEAVLEASGLNPKRLLPVVIAVKVLSIVLLPLAMILWGVLGHMAMTQIALFAAVAMAAGALVPEWGLKMLRRPYVKALQRGVVDALDLLVVCAEAGMGLEAALEEVAKQMRQSNLAMAAALTLLVNDLRVLSDRKQAFANFGDRSGVDGIRRMAAIISQSMRYGTPLGQALRAVSDELRREQATRLEAKAVKLPTMLVFPLVVFILPSLFIVLLGGPMMQLMGTLYHSSKTAAAQQQSVSQPRLHP